MGCERCKSSKVKAAQSMYLDKHFKKFDDQTLTAHLKIVRDAQAEIPLRFSMGAPQPCVWQTDRRAQG